MTPSLKSIALLLIQLGLVFSIAAKYLYQRSVCPKVWTRAVAYDPELVMRGRYLSARLKVDVCHAQLPAAHEDLGTPQDHSLVFNEVGSPHSTTALPVILGVRDGKLRAKRTAQPGEEHTSQQISLRKGDSCLDAVLQEPVDFYLPEHAKSPFPLSKTEELWVEVTVPPKGPPRPIQLALKQGATWTPLAFQ